MSLICRYSSQLIAYSPSAVPTQETLSVVWLDLSILRSVSSYRFFHSSLGYFCIAFLKLGSLSMIIPF